MSNRAGQTWLEYTLILATIAVIAFGAYLALGNNLGALANRAASELTSA